MMFQTAIYGEVSGGHALRKASADAEFAHRIAGRLDLPSNPPSGIHWSPSVCGFPVEGRYVVARTVLDESASRANMVLVYAAFAPLDEVQSFTSLASLFGGLVVRMAAEADATAIDLPDDDPIWSPAELLNLASLLVSKAKKPVLKFDFPGFEELVAALWQNLLPEMRREFAFRLSFGPDDIYEEVGPSFVWSPSDLAARWRDFPVLGHSGAAQTSLAADILAGVQDNKVASSFAERFAITDRSLPAFVQMTTAMQLITGAPTVDELAGAIRLIDRLSPRKDAGVEAKRALLAQFVQELPSASSSQVMGLRNLSLQGFGGLASVWTALSEWFETQALRQDGIAETLAAFQHKDSAISSWREAIKEAGRALGTRRIADFAPAFWAILSDRPELAPSLVELLSTSSKSEAALIGAIPDKVSFDLAPLLTTLVDCGWLALHGATLAAGCGPLEAVQRQLQVDRAAENITGLRAALKHASPEERVEIAIGHNDPRLDLIAAEQICSQLDLLGRLDHRALAVQRLWSAAIGLDAKACDAFSDALAARNEILEARLDERDVYEPLVDRFSETRLGDLNGFPRRAEVWNLTPYGSRFLSWTAEAWVKLALSAHAPATDPRLEQAILGAAALRSLLASNDIMGAVQVMAQLKDLPETTAQSWFDATVASGLVFSESEAERLGYVVVERNWSTLLDTVAERAGTDHQLRATLRVCAAMLPAWTRWRLGVTDITVDEKWDLLMRIAAALYPMGPDQNHLWERAGGKDSDLLRGGNGQSAWRSALQLVRQGGGPPAALVISEMLKDFPGNADLRFVAADRDLNRPPREVGRRPWWSL